MMGNLNSIPLPDTMVAVPVGPNHDLCPRDKSKLRPMSDHYGPSQDCLHCGYSYSMESPDIATKLEPLLSGTVRRLRYKRGPHIKRFEEGKILFYRYFRTTAAGTALWLPDCPWCSRRMRKAQTHESRQDVGQLNFKCLYGHRIAIIDFESKWR